MSFFSISLVIGIGLGFWHDPGGGLLILEVDDFEAAEADLWVVVVVPDAVELVGSRLLLWHSPLSTAMHRKQIVFNHFSS